MIGFGSFLALLGTIGQCGGTLKYPNVKNKVTIKIPLPRRVQNTPYFWFLVKYKVFAFFGTFRQFLAILGTLKCLIVKYEVAIEIALPRQF